MLSQHLENYKVILASKSPRRQELLRGMGVMFDCITKETPEQYPEMPLKKVAGYLSRQKSIAFSDEELPEHYLLITADTVVIAENEILGKPTDRADALRMLNLLSGKTHVVVTGVTLRSKERTTTFSVSSSVTFATLNREVMEHYVDQYRPFDKAGAYGIQEWIGYVGISGLRGSFYNVMGLPTQRLYNALMKF
ncbi:MAG: septum formation protein Maf [Bacteroidales bacterium]|nr:septum formation protein Maf [Bacteroidales bacterium]